MNAPAASTRRWPASRSAERQGGPPSLKLRRAAFARIEREGWKEARRSRAAERDASGGGTPRAPGNAGSRVRPGTRLVITTAAAVVLAGSSSVLACPVCFGADETALVDGTKLGVLLLLAITLVVQGSFVGFFLYLRRRAKRAADVELDTEWSELQKART
jgi:hypothetical protein